MTDTEANRPEGGALSDDAAIASLMMAPEEDKPEPDDVEETEAEPAEGEDAEGDEPEAEEADDADEDAEDSEPEPEPSKFTVKVDGEEIEVTQDELLRGYQRDADYRRKTQALAEERRALAEQRDRLLQQLEATTEKEPDWVKLAEEDPFEYNKKRAEWERQQAQRTVLQQQAAQERQQQTLQAARAEAERLRAAVPEWSDRARAREDLTKLTKVAQEYGFSEQEAAATLDHRAWLILKDAAAYRQLMAEKPKVEAKKKAAPKKSLPAGSTTSKAERQSKERDAHRQRLKRSGRPEDAIALILGG